MLAPDFLSAARRIAERIATGAEWSGDSCTWGVRTPQASLGPRQATVLPATGGVYQGTAGIAWFLGETAQYTGSDPLRQAALGAITNALDLARELPEGDFGFHSGRPGIAWVAVRLAEIFERPELRERATECLEPLHGQAARDQGLDVIGGAAGAIPALLDLARRLERPELADTAIELGEHLIRHAHLEPQGWSWNTIGPSAARHVCGFAHGAAGFALALLEIYRATGNSRFLFAAEMAFLYERQFFAPEMGNWPDLRNTDMGDFIFYGRTDDLRTLAREGRAPRYERHYMYAWCHGAPGIGLSRLRAYELTGQELYLQEALAAVESTVRMVEGETEGGGNFSLCHGIGGNCELPLLAAAQLGDRDEWLEPCRRAAEHGWRAFEEPGRPWPCGTANGEPDASLLVGEAGIGAFFLRLAAPDLPSLLLLRPALDAEPDSDSDGFQALARETARAFFGPSLELLRRLRPDAEIDFPRPGEAPLELSPVVGTYEALREIARSDGDPLLADAFRLDRKRYEMTLALEDFNLEFLRNLTRRPWQELDLDEGRFELPEGSRLLSTEHDWSTWLRREDPAAVADALADEVADAAAPEPGETHFLLHTSGNRILSQRVGAFTAIILFRAREPASFAELVDRVADSLDESVERSQLEPMIYRQLEQLYRAGFLDHQP